jgi:hypothetical protein
MAERVESQIERFAPGFRDCILARHSVGPVDLEKSNPNLAGGDINGGAANLTQLIARPILSPTPYRTPLRGVYLCSASTPPGGVHGRVRLQRGAGSREGSIRPSLRRNPSKSENRARFSGKLKTCERCNSIDILSERQNLEISPKHFWMQERLQRALRLCIGIALRDVVGQLGNYPGDEMMLIGEAFDFETARLRTLDNTRPFDMRGDIGVPDLIEW